jgi:hypothetical protein
MTLCWAAEDGVFHCAEMKLGEEGALRVLVQGVGGLYWDWQAWDEAQRVESRWGLADTLADAKARAERALAEMASQISQAPTLHGPGLSPPCTLTARRPA